MSKTGSIDLTVEPDSVISRSRGVDWDGVLIPFKFLGSKIFITSLEHFDF